MAIYCQEFDFYPIDISGVLVKMEPDLALLLMCIWSKLFFNSCQFPCMSTEGIDRIIFKALSSSNNLYKSELEKLKQFKDAVYKSIKSRILRRVISLRKPEIL